MPEKRNGEVVAVGAWPDGANLYRCVFELAVKPHCHRKCSKWKRVPKEWMRSNVVIRGLLVHHWLGPRDPVFLRNMGLICMTHGIAWRPH